MLLPYLARVLGNAEWGVLVFGQSFAYIVGFFVTYGFALSGTRKVAKLKEKPELLGRAVASIHLIKVVFSGFTFFLLFGIAWITPIFNYDVPVIFWSIMLGLAIGQNLTWLYQGMNKLVQSSSLYISANVIYGILTFIVVKNDADLWKVLALQASLQHLASFMLFLKSLSMVRLSWPNFSDIKIEIAESFTLFISQGALVLYSRSNTYILGLFVSPEAVGLWGGAEKIYKALVALVLPISNTMFPRISAMVDTDFLKARSMQRMVSKYQFLLMLFIAAFVVFLAPFLVKLLLGEEYMASVWILQLLVLSMPFIGLSNSYGIQWMIPNGLDKEFNGVMVLGGVLNTLMGIFFAYFYGENGMPFTVILVEIAMLMGFLWMLNTKKLL